MGLTMNRQERAEFAQRIAARFQELKDAEGWTQATLVEAAGVKVRTVSDVLRGVSVPNEITVRKLGSAMGLEPTPDLVRAKWKRYEDFFDILGLYLDARPQSEHDAIMQRVFAALPPERSDGA